MAAKRGLGKGLNKLIPTDDGASKSSGKNNAPVKEKVVEKVVENLLEVDCAVLGNHSYMETSLIGEMLTSNLCVPISLPVIYANVSEVIVIESI